MNTEQQYDAAIEACKTIFLLKTADYGTAWTVLRPISIVDQLFIKAKRIRTIQETGVQRVGDDIRGEFLGIVNYGVIGLIQWGRPKADFEEYPVEQASGAYDAAALGAKTVMLDKNHDYGEAWRDMSLEGLVDLILVKLLRIRQILANDGRTLISEGVDAGYIDIINYAVFALILNDTK
ncbi:DUF1599 domain-containing protein [Dinghuibacter silviterrae]|uniref:Uncharacterized protein DUF1599 n=1 Tax=Dinghuibacter silviterrae TaxID=1539049 RepID=A0A4R8DTQ6_9BACT|nr:DUF1599 domain-containing protein [Dinghuibacter silviterrae]TDX01694.1 uncharacterized protein DUF1599 [Dinghuibacter silviterrae]